MPGQQETAGFASVSLAEKSIQQNMKGTQTKRENVSMVTASSFTFDSSMGLIFHLC